MNISSEKSWYVNPNTRQVTLNRNNTKIMDQEAFEKAGMQQRLLRPIVDWEQVMRKPIKFADRSYVDRQTNSVDIPLGQSINVQDGYVLKVLQAGVFTYGGNDPYDTEAEARADGLAGALSTLLRNASGNVHLYMAKSKKQLAEWSERVSEVMKYLGIDPSRDFTVNGMKYSKNEDGAWESETDTKAKAAMEKLRANNRTYTFADEKTRNEIEYISNYHLRNATETLKQAWQQTLKETGVNPFADGLPKTLSGLSMEQDLTTGGNDDVFGSDLESNIEGVKKILDRLEHPLETEDDKNDAMKSDAEKKAEAERAAYREQEKAFYTALLGKIV